MKLFIRRIFTFSCVFTVIILALFSVRIISHKTTLWKLPKKNKIIFMGASHVEAGINPDFIDDSQNIASSSERYMFTYLKLKELISVNPQIETVILQFAPTDVNIKADSKYFEKNEMLHFLPLYFPMFSSDEWQIYLNHSNEVAINSMDVILKKLPFNIPTSVNSYGKYSPLVGNFDSNKEPYKLPEWSINSNTINIKYLNKIIKLCNSNNIKVLFIYMPMYNKNYFYDLDYYYETYYENFSKIKLLDYSDLELPDSLRKDEHHLNKKGSDFFSIKLNNDLKQIK